MQDLPKLLAELEGPDAIELVLATGQRASVRYRDGHSVGLTTRPLTPGELRDVLTGTPLTATVRRATPGGIEDSIEVGGRSYRVRAVRAGVAIALRLSPWRPAPRARKVFLPTPAPMRTATASARSEPQADQVARRPPEHPRSEVPRERSLQPRSAREGVTSPPAANALGSPRPAARPSANGPAPAAAAGASQVPPAPSAPRPDRAAAAAEPPGQPASGAAELTSAAPQFEPSLQAAPRGAARIPTALVALIEEGRDVDASDLHLLPGAPPRARTAEGLSPLGSPIPGGALDSFAEALAATPAGARAYPSDQVRVTAVPGLGGIALHVRLYPRHRPTLDDLGLAEIAARLGDLRRGLVLVGSRRGHGRGTTRAALAEHLACSFGRATASLAPTDSPYAGGLARWWQGASPDDALEVAEAQSVEVLAFPDLSSGGWVRAAQRAVEAGRVVIATVAARAGGEVVTRALDCAEDPAELAAFLAGELRLAVYQELFPAAAGAGRVAALETLWGGPRLWTSLQVAAEGRGAPTLSPLLQRRSSADARSLATAAEELATLGRIRERDAARAAERAAPPLAPLDTRGQTTEPAPAAAAGDASSPGGRPGGLGGRLGSLFRAKDGRAGAKRSGKPEGGR